MVNGKFEESWHARYERWATTHEAEHLIAGWSEKGLSRRLALVLRTLTAARLQPGSTILDLGAGPGTYTRAITALGHRCLGLDYSRKVLQIAKTKHPEGDYIQAEAYHLPFRSMIFDGVICVGVLQSLQSIHEALREAHRVLQPGGFLFLEGLNSLFWLHGLRSWKESLRRLDKRMSYYNPFVIMKYLTAIGFKEPDLSWLLMPEQFQHHLDGRSRSGFALVPRLFGYSFLIFAQKQAGHSEN